MHPPDDAREWLQTDGLGGFAMGTASLIRTRCYHALLTVAAAPPTHRFALVKDFEAWLDMAGQRVWLTSHRYRGGLIHPDGWTRLAFFQPHPWPTWRYRLPTGHFLDCDLLIAHGRPTVWLRWTLLGTPHHNQPARLFVRPLLAGSPLHHCHRENPDFRFDASLKSVEPPGLVGAGVSWVPDNADSTGRTSSTPRIPPAQPRIEVAWRPYPGVPALRALANARYRHAPEWYRAFQLDAEIERGLPAEEDLASPGVFEFDLAADSAILRLAGDLDPGVDEHRTASPRDDIGLWHAAAGRERARYARLQDPLALAAEHYLVRRGAGKTLIAGYPWFTDWGRDTFIALRGLCLATGRLGDARDILVQWAGHVSRGMLPNRFPDEGQEPEFNSVDASLWYIVAVGEYLEQAAQAHALDPRDRDHLRQAVDAIIDGYAAGTRHHIRLDSDGLIAAGEPGVQLTWMDARHDGVVFTPRIGKPVEVQALWINALHVARAWNPDRERLLNRARESFAGRFWNEHAGCLFDVIDADHRPGSGDPAIRPNQIFAVGGLPLQVLDGPRAASVLRVVRDRLWTPLGLRTLDPAHPDYRPRYEGDPHTRDSAYHQGTVWPWLIGPFVEAHLRVHGTAPEALDHAERLLQPLLAHLDEAGLGHISEIFDAEPPRLPRGCPFQAWSLAELIRARTLIARARAR